MSAEQPTPLPLKLATIPEALKVERRWVCWRYVLRSGKWTKAPVNPRTGGLASSTNADTWGTYEAALAAIERHGVQGIGFVFGDGWAGVDLDNCLTAAGQPAPWAAADVAALASYTEVSPSGKGVKVFVRGSLPPGSRRRNQYEMYDEARFFTVTGHHLPGTPTTVEERTAELTALHARVFPDDAGQASPVGSRPTPILSKLDDRTLIDRAMGAKNGAKFAALWRGDAAGYASHSEADLALCSLLAFWVGPDPDRVDHLFRQSGLYRDKWDRADYRLGTLDAAMQRSDFYTPAEPIDAFFGSKGGHDADGDSDEATKTPWLVSVTDLMAEPDEEEVWLVDSLLRGQTVTLVVGPPKTFKSFAVQGLHVALGAGIPAFGAFTCPKPVRCVYVQEESARLYLRRRYRGIHAGYGLHPAATRGQLYAITNQRFRLDREDDLRRLIDEVMEIHRPDTIAFDTLRSMHWLDENASEQMQPLIARLHQVRDEYGVAIQIVHHMNKNVLARDDGEAIRGSSVIWGSSDGALFLRPTDQAGVVRVSPNLKEGAGADAFLLRLGGAEGAITFEVIDLDGKGVTEAGILSALGRLGWVTAPELASALGVSERTVRPRLKGMTQRGAIRSKPRQTNGRPITLYALSERSDDDPDF